MSFEEGDDDFIQMNVPKAVELKSMYPSVLSSLFYPFLCSNHGSCTRQSD